MRWTKLKKNLEERFSSDLKGRIYFHITKYSSEYDLGDLANRAWVTVDGEEIANFSTLEAFKITGCSYNKTTPTGCWSVKKEYTHRTPELLVEKGEFSMLDFTECSFAFLNMNIDEAINHESPLINALAIIDKRFGKRRLTDFGNGNLHPLVNYFYNLRLEGGSLK